MSPDRPIAIEILNLNFQYPLAGKQILHDINLTIYQGEYVVITGPTGSGKTTLALCLNGIIPHLMEGELSGEVRINGYSVADHPVHELTPHIGMVFQNPEDQLFSLNVTDEVAFGVENMGYSRQEIIERVDRAIQQVHLSDRRNYSIFKLSGGQKQKVAIASNLAIAPDILVLDAPTADLDPISSAEVVNTLVDLRQQDSKRTFIVINSDLSDVVNLATRLIVLDDGKVALDGSPADLLRDHFSELEALGIRIPDHIRLMHWLSQEFSSIEAFETEEDKVRELVNDLCQANRLVINEPVTIKDDGSDRGEPVISFQDVSFQFKDGPVILKHANLAIARGEWVAIIGENGTGKSTVLKLIGGLIKPQAGQIHTIETRTEPLNRDRIPQRVGYLFQNPDHQLFMSTVEDEIGFTPRSQGRSLEETKQRVDEALRLMRLEESRGQHPFTLSRGQRQRLAVATVLAARPELLLLDEPTTGQDQIALDNLLHLTNRLIEEHGATVVMVTHDMDVVAQYASRVIVLHQGQILLDGTPTEVFCQGRLVLEKAKLRPPRMINLTAHLHHQFQTIPTYSQMLNSLSAL